MRIYGEQCQSVLTTHLETKQLKFFIVLKYLPIGHQICLQENRHGHHANTIKLLRCLFGKLLNSESSSFPNIGEDEFLSESCGILNKLLPWNLVLADRGFTILEDMMLQQAQLAIPPFTKGKGQLYIVDIEKAGGSQMFAFMSKVL